MMDDEVVGRGNWLTREQFLDLLGATNLIPGPNSTGMAILKVGSILFGSGYVLLAFLRATWSSGGDG